MTAEEVLGLHTDGFNRALQQHDYAALGQSTRTVICSFGQTGPC